MVNTITQLTLADAHTALATVPDPEIPVVSITDLGMVFSVTLTSPTGVHVELLPTFSGCPALDIIESLVREALEAAGFTQITVHFNMHEAYTTSRITEQGREGLRKWGITPPSDDGRMLVADTLDFLEHVPCPHCNSTSTTMRSPFGPALCRSLHFCYSCNQAFEAFKPVC
jgi:ring-1,2-phenylacetyl-CoA epoxidase subunit PaaD